jgi:hypothetical protein
MEMIYLLIAVIVAIGVLLKALNVVLAELLNALKKTCEILQLLLPNRNKRKKDGRRNRGK